MKKSAFLLLILFSSLMSLSAAAGLSQKEIDGLLLMREEEKLARDVYLTLFDKTGIRAFSNIARSEQTHMSAVLDLLELFGIEDPLSSNERGVFTNQKMQNLYDSLSAAESELDAVKTGLLIEDLDIHDLQELLADTESEDIQEVYENLIRGSRNHLRAFYRQFQRYGGGTYRAQYISRNEVEEIIGSRQERGTGH